MMKLPDMSGLNESRILITGGTGSLGNKLAATILGECGNAKVVIYSRDEFKQSEMRRAFSEEQRNRLRFFLGDVRDGDRLTMAMKGVDYVIHTAALKQVPAAEYNPFEFVKTNVLGAQNIISSAISCDVGNVVALSTDKAANPINLYGATKLCSDKLFVAGNSYSGSHRTRFCVVRYGNVVGSRGSVVPFFLARRKTGKLPVTDKRMTRFWITLKQAGALVINALLQMQGGEIWVPKIPSMRIVDLARTIGPDCELEDVGIRPGEKLHEVMVPTDDARMAEEFDTHYVVRPGFPWWDEIRGPRGRQCDDGFYYGSDNNDRRLDGTALAGMIAELDLPEAKEWAREREN